MGVLSFGEIYEGNAFSQELERGRREGTRVFRAITSPGDDSHVVEQYAITTAGFIVGVSTYGDAGCILKKIHAVNDQTNRETWLCTMTYDSVLCRPEMQGANPLTRPPMWSGGTSKYEQVVEVDALGQTVQNSACQPFGQPLTIQRSQSNIEIVVNKATFNYFDVKTYEDKINSDTWMGFPPFTVRVDSIPWKQAQENGINYFELKWNLSIKEDGWNPVNILDKGQYVRVPNTSSAVTEVSSSCGMTCDGKLQVCTDKFGQPVTAEQLLDGAGQKLPDGACPVYLQFFPYNAIPFTGVVGI